MSALLPERVRSLIASYPAARRCWLAYSGGVDSEVLLHVLAGLRERLAPQLGAIHVDHGLHPDSPAWAVHCRRSCARLGVPLVVRALKLNPAPGESLEAVAREARYGALRSLMQPGDLLLTAQHRDDQAETVLLALLRGSGPKGLAAMPLAAAFGPGHLLRPLLDVSRRELMAYAHAHGLSWLEDPANADLQRDRNFIRHRVLPLLAQRWPSCGATFARTAGHCAEAQGLIDASAEGALAEVRGARSETLSITSLRKLDAPLAKAVLRLWFSGLGLPLPDARNLARIRAEVLTARTDAAPLVAWPGCEVRRYRDELCAMAPLPQLPSPANLTWMRGELTLPRGLGRLKLTTLDDSLIDPVEVADEGFAVRFGITGLACRTAPGGGRRMLKKLFQEAGIPSWLRSYVPLLFACGDLIAIGDWCVCASQATGSRSGFRICWEGGIRLHPGFPARARSAAQ